ncbi:MAG: hypothetical protein JSS74_08145 [Actinobacteria bacterium]|nr:hypothetical protein [Actinomycetota bacterium]
MNKSPRIRLLALTVSLAALASTSLAGCSALTGGTVSHLIFEDRAEAVAQAAYDIPAWVPADARMITLDYQQHDRGYLLIFSSRTGVAASGDCAAADGDSPTPPTSAWPKASQIDARMHCGTSTIVRTPDQWFAWVQK